MKKTVAIIGSSGAIGNAVSDNLINDESIGIIYKFSRSMSVKENERVKNIFLDIEDEESIKSSLDHVPSDTKFDLVFVQRVSYIMIKKFFQKRALKI